MPKDNKADLQTDIGEVKSAGVKTASNLGVEGEIPCIIVYPDRKHVSHINNIINPILDFLSQKGFKPYLITDDTFPDSHFGATFETLADNCALGIVILDGLRPNVVWEYGFLKGKNKPIVTLQSKKACVAIKSFYQIQSDSGKAIKLATGLTEFQFKTCLMEPPIGYFYHLSDRGGIKVVVLDSDASFDSADHPRNKIEKEVAKLMPRITEEFSKRRLEPIRGIAPEYFQRFHTLALNVSEYYAGTKLFNSHDIESAIREMRELEKSSGVNMPSQVYGTVASLYINLAHKTEWMKVAEIIGFYNKAIGIYNGILESNPAPNFRSETQKKIGDIYIELSHYQDINDNCNKAIKAYKEALKVYTIQRSPMAYALTQSNLGVAYSGLSEIESKADNCKKAIKAYEQALKVRTFRRFPMDYALTQNNLGNAYGKLAEVEAKAQNCRKALKSYKEALKVYTLKRFPMDYAMAQNNLGNAYETLAEVEAKEENCKKALKAFKEALKVYTLKRFPMDYAMAQNNLGNVYRTLAEVEAKAQNCRKALKSYKEALKIYTLERFPIQYAMAQNNLGNAHGTLAVVEAKQENCNRAIKAFKEALKVYTIERFPMDYAMAQNNLGNAYRILAEVKTKAQNCKKALKAYREALKVCTFERFPIQYATAQNNLGNAYRTLAEVEAKAQNCKKARKAYEEALKVYTKKNFPEVYLWTASNLKGLLDFCGINK